MNTVGRRIGQGATVGYALLWALVLPFICWANWAQPGHAHAAPHFVFSEPPTHIQPFHSPRHRYPTKGLSQTLGVAPPPPSLPQFGGGTGFAKTHLPPQVGEGRGGVNLGQNPGTSPPTHAEHSPIVREHDPSPVQAGSADGAARPLTLVVALLVLVILRFVPLPRPWLHHWPQTARLILPPFYALPIPTPPPRPAYLGGSLPGYLD